jgi:hypothetical protein
VNADVEINTAIFNLIPGGRVLLTEGTFNTAAQIIVPYGATLEGLGRGTHIVADVNDDWAVEGDDGAIITRMDITNTTGHGARIVGAGCVG